MAWRTAAIGLLVAAIMSNLSRAAGPRYAITMLQQLVSATNVYASGVSINDSGVIAGQEYNVSYPKPIVWSADNQASRLALPAGMTYGAGLNISPGGVIAGNSATAAAPYSNYPTLYGTTNSSVLQVAGANKLGDVFGIDASGRVLASMRDNTLVRLTTSGATTFNTTGITTTYFQYGTTGQTDGYAANSQSGDVVVTTANVTLNGKTVVRPLRLSTTAAPQMLYSEDVNGGVADVNESGLAVGSTVATNGSPRSAIYRGGHVVYPTLSGFTSTFDTLTAVNDRGRYVGYRSGQRALVGEDDVLYDLNTFIDPASGWTLREADDINNRGQIIGLGTYDDDHNAATPAKMLGFRLDPIRKPGDTNYDDVVDFTDLLTLARNYGKSGDGNVFYETGDFNYDWRVDFADLLTLARHYGQPTGFASDWSLAQSLTPEPATLAAVVTLPMLVKRRRPRAKRENRAAVVQ